MPDTEQDFTQDQPEPYQLTGDDLSELHEVARQLQAAGDPRADRVFNFIDAHSGGNPDPAAKGQVYRRPLKVTSWLQDLESTLWGDSANDTSASDGASEGGDDPENVEESAANDGSSAPDASTSIDGQTAQRSQRAQQQPAQQPQNKSQQPAQSQQQQPNQQSQQQKQVQPQPTATVVVTYDKKAGIAYGSHSGLYLTGTPDGEVLYDPSGSYRQRTRGSGALFTKDDDNVSLEDYIKYHKGAGSEVKAYTFDLSPADAKQIYERAEKQGERVGPFCATYVSSAISGIGPFSRVHGSWRPGVLADELENLQFAGNPYVTNSTGSGKGFGGGGGSAW